MADPKQALLIGLEVSALEDHSSFLRKRKLRGNIHFTNFITFELFSIPKTLAWAGSHAIQAGRKFSYLPFWADEEKSYCPVVILSCTGYE